MERILLACIRTINTNEHVTTPNTEKLNTSREQQ